MSSSGPESKPPVAVTYRILAVVFAAGGLTSAVTYQATRIADLEARQTAHEHSDMHEGARRELELLQQRQAVAELQLREARAKTEAITENFHKINRRLDAMCAAIPRCERQK
jgi:hypothetical protein